MTSQWAELEAAGLEVYYDGPWLRWKQLRARAAEHAEAHDLVTTAQTPATESLSAAMSPRDRDAVGHDAVTAHNGAESVWQVETGDDGRRFVAVPVSEWADVARWSRN